MPITNEPAFPYVSDSNPWPGMTKREYYAAMAMQGILAANSEELLPLAAKHAVNAADYLINELSKPQLP